MVKTCPFCNSVKPRPGKISLERTSTRRIWRPHLFRSWAGKIVLDGATSHLTAHQCKSTFPSEVIAKLHEWMDTFQMNPNVNCADMAFHYLHDMQAFYRMHNVNRIPTGPHTPWPNRAEMGVRLFKKFLLALVDTACKNLDQTTLAQITPAQLMRKAATVRNTQLTSSGMTPMELAMGRRPRDRLDPASMNPEHPPRSCWTDEVCSSWPSCRRTCVLLARRSEQDPARTEIWKMFEGGNHCSQELHGCCQYRCDHISGKHKQAEETVGHWIWKNFQTRVSEQERVCCGSLVKVRLMFGRCSRTTLIWALSLTGKDFKLPLQLTWEQRRLKVSRHSWHRSSGKSSRKRIPRLLWCPRLSRQKASKRKRWYGNSITCVCTWQNIKFLAENTSLFWDQNQERFGGWKRCNIYTKKSTIANGPPAWWKTHVDFSQSWQSSASTGINTGIAWASDSYRMGSTHSSWRLHVKSKSFSTSSASASASCANQRLLGPCSSDYTRRSSTGHELDQGLTRRVETTEPCVGHQDGADLQTVYRKIELQTSTSQLTDASLWAQGDNWSFTGIHRQLQRIFPRMWQSFDVIFAECALPVLYVTSGHPRLRFWHLCGQWWIHRLGAPLQNPFKTNWREGLSCSPIQLFQHRVWSAFDPREWRMVVFWKEDSGRQPQLITPEHEGGDETSSPSPPRCTFFDDPDVPLNPPDTPPAPPAPPGPPDSPGLPPGLPPVPPPAGGKERARAENAPRERSRPRSQPREPQLKPIPMSDDDDDQSPQDERQRQRSSSRDRVHPNAQAPQTPPIPAPQTPPVPPIHSMVIQEPFTVPDEDSGSSGRRQISRSRERAPVHVPILPMMSQQLWNHKVAWVTVQGRHKEKKVHKDRRERKPQPKWRSRVNCQRQRSKSPWTQTKTMKYHKTNQELLQTLSLQYQYYLSSQDQHPGHTVHRPVLLRPVHKEHRPVPALRMNPLTTMTSTEKENLAQQHKVHEVMTPKRQCSVQTSMFWPMMSTGQWRRKHTSMQLQPGHFVSWLRKTENNRISTTWLPHRVCSDHCASMKWLTIPAAHKLNSQKGVDSQTRDMLERSIATCGKAAGAKAKRRSRARKEASAQEVRGYYKQFPRKYEDTTSSFLKQNTSSGNPGSTMKFLISLIWGSWNRRTMWPDDEYLPSRPMNKQHPQGKGQMGTARFPR